MLIEDNDYSLNLADHQIRFKSDRAKRAFEIMYPTNEIKSKGKKPWPFDEGYISLEPQYGRSTDLVANLPPDPDIEWLPSILQSYLSSQEVN